MKTPYDDLIELIDMEQIESVHELAKEEVKDHLEKLFSPDNDDGDIVVLGIKKSGEPHIESFGLKSGIVKAMQSNSTPEDFFIGFGEYLVNNLVFLPMLFTTSSQGYYQETDPNAPTPDMDELAKELVGTPANALIIITVGAHGKGLFTAYNREGEELENAEVQITDPESPHYTHFPPIPLIVAGARRGVLFNIDGMN